MALKLYKIYPSLFVTIMFCFMCINNLVICLSICGELSVGKTAPMQLILHYDFRLCTSSLCDWLVVC